MPGIEQALFANDAFYVAFQSGDFGAMDDLWARGHQVTCIHPGWHHLAGREDVMESWRNILANPDQDLNIRFLNGQANLYAETAVIVGYEIVGRASTVATNLFVIENGVWKMVHHQAGGGPIPPEVLGGEDDERLQ